MTTMQEIFGEPISIYTRAQAIEDGTLIDLTEWASADKGFIGGARQTLRAQGARRATAAWRADRRSL